ncbi:MAG: T9SS type A sorting domain-containing protein [Bacteroidota bacterium]
MNSRYLLLLILCLGFGSLEAQEIDYSLFTEEVYSTGWSHPTGMIFDDNGQMYVWNRFGRFYTAPEGVKPSSPTLNIEAEVGSWNDHGLLKVAFPPPPAFEIFPNPTSRLLNVKMRRIYGSGELILSDINGKVVLRQEWEAETNDFADQILIEDLPLGLYFYQLDNGQSRISGKIFKTL